MRKSLRYCRCGIGVNVGVTRGCTGCTCTPRAEKKWGRNLQGKVVSAPPRQRKSSIIEGIFAGPGEIWSVGVVNLAVSACVLGRLLKRSSTFLRKKVHPQRKSWLHLCNAVHAVDRMLYWSVGGGGTAARFIHRTTLDGAAGDKVQQFVDVTDDSVTAAAATAVQDIVVDVRTRRFAYTDKINMLCIDLIRICYLKKILLGLKTYLVKVIELT